MTLDELKAKRAELDRQIELMERHEWAPEPEGEYWFVNERGESHVDDWLFLDVDYVRLRLGNVFQTEREAEDHALWQESFVRPAGQATPDVEVLRGWWVVNYILGTADQSAGACLDATLQGYYQTGILVPTKEEAERRLQTYRSVRLTGRREAQP